MTIYEALDFLRNTIEGQQNGLFEARDLLHAAEQHITVLEREIETLRNPPPPAAPFFEFRDSLALTPVEGPGSYHLDAPATAFAVKEWPGRKALEVLIRKDQPLRGSNRRCKSEFGLRDDPAVKTYKRLPQGRRILVGFDLFVPPDWARNSSKVPFFSFRSHDDEAKVALRLAGDRCYLFHPATLDAKPAIWQVPIDDIKGTWTRFDFDCIFSATTGASTRLSVNGKLVADSDLPNGYPDGDLYFKMGLYAPFWSEPERFTAPVFIPTEIRIGLSNLSVVIP